jgi:hypothetical protein
MSRPIDLFIDAPLELDELAAEITKLTGCELAEVPGRRGRVLSSGDVVAELDDHDFVDDRELLFTRYKYVLSATVASERSVNDSPQAALLRRIFSAIKADDRYPSLLVFDLQHLMDRSGHPPSQSPSQPVGPVGQ